jgi:hypothetical protein|tara:strand:+ start:701 stop:841 length:141 start_codon:yes stop_codon:yes gene_type:complete
MGNKGLAKDWKTFKGNVKSYEMKIRTPDGEIHAIEFRGMPERINSH